MFWRLLAAKRVEKLDKLQSSAQQVAGMQQELRVHLPFAMVLIKRDLYFCVQE